MSQLRLSLSALVITGMLFTVACGPQSEDTSSEPNTSTEQLLETPETEPDTSQTAEKKKVKCDYKDPTRRFVSRDPSECPAILFFCNEGETAFFNECGCGCVTNP